MQLKVKLLSAAAIASLPASEALTLRGDRTVTQVVKFLQDLLKQSQDEGDKERELYAKFKCYCDINTATKTKEIADEKRSIAMLEGDIESLKGSTAVASSAKAKTEEDLFNNEMEIAQAQGVRDDEKKAFGALESDLSGAIASMNDAIKTLAEVGADQTVSESADHKQFMDGNAFLQMRNSVKQALMVARAVLDQQKIQAVDAFLQAAPGTYSAQSGEVVGILKDMRDTFKSNLAEAGAKEEKAQADFDEFMKTKLEEQDTLKASHIKQKGILGSNDGDLAAASKSLTSSQISLEEAETFLDDLTRTCEDKAKAYNRRVDLRTQEDAAITQSVSILNSDAAFSVFGDTKTGAATSFFQRKAVRNTNNMQQAQALLQKAIGGVKSSHIRQVMALMQANNPFAVVLKEIDKFIGVIAEEEKADDEHKAWCVSERKETNGKIDGAKSDISALDLKISGLNKDINDPKEGLLAVIDGLENSLQETLESQKSQSAQRKEENMAYQKNIANLVEAEKLLEGAVKVLVQYYAKIDPPSLLELKSEERGTGPEPPSTFSNDKYEGQGAGGNKAISMIEFIVKNTKAEENAAHDDERKAQHAFEDSMKTLKETEESTRENIASMKETLAKKEETLKFKEKDLKATKEEKAKLEDYLTSIKPGCDFIMDNIDLRKKNRIAETKALEGAADLIKNSPAHKEAVAAQHVEDLGECKDICEPDEEHVKCKACLADVSVSGYCAGHAGTKGC